MDDEQGRRVRAWVDRYVQAWNSNSPADIGALFGDDAAYYTEPYRQPWRGRDEIVRRWLARRDEPGDTTFQWRPLTVGPEVAVVQGETVYRDLLTPSATFGSSAWTPKAAAPSSPSGGWSTRSSERAG
jgi:uncharacterized protein (TIGR02246 family)